MMPASQNISPSSVDILEQEVQRSALQGVVLEKCFGATIELQLVRISELMDVYCLVWLIL